MNEIICNQIISTVPIHFLAYAPFLKHLRLGCKRTFALVAAAEVIYILLFGTLLGFGFSLSLIQLIAMLIFGILFFLSVDMEPGKILFLYIFCVAYLMVIRGLAAYLVSILYKTSVQSFYSGQSGILTGILYIITMPAILWYFKRTAQIVFEVDAPQIWQKVWCLPTFNTLGVLLFTYSPQEDAQINTKFVMARILLLLCMFLTYYFVLQSIHRLRLQAEAEARARYLQQIADVQATQYRLLKSHMDETRQTRHDLRHHLRAIQGYIDNGDLSALASYIQDYSGSIPTEAFHDYCGNSAVNSILTYYAEKAAKEHLQMNIFFCPLQDTLIPEPEFCVLLGNLLENALDACCSTKNNAAPISPTITVRAGKTGSHMLTLTVDNTCTVPPVSLEGRFLSSKHKSFGIGT